MIGFIFRYIWVVCGLLILFELASTTYSSVVLMKQSAQGVMDSVSGELSGRVDGVLRLLQGLANDSDISDTATPLYDRAILLRPYEESYDLFMIALTDEQIQVVSSDEVAPPTTMTSLAYRAYMQTLYQTGEYQITDAFLAGSDGVTLNYTIAVPIMKEQRVVGSVFGAIYFKDIEQIMLRNREEGQTFYLLGKESGLMSADKTISGKTFREVAKNTHFFNTSADAISKELDEGIPGTCWQWGSNGFSYVMYQQVAPTHWTLVYEVSFLSIIMMLIPAMVIKVFFYLLICGLISVLGKRYVNQHLSSINYLIDQVAMMQKELFHSETEGYDDILSLSKKGLVDQLTGLSTRAVLLSNFPEYTSSPCAILFIDLDDLKTINDSYGHVAGDHALIQFAKVLQTYEKQTNGFVARYGGDEFVFLLPYTTIEQLQQIAQELHMALHQQITSEQVQFMSHASIGISRSPNDGTTLEELICKADLAVYSAKQAGKDQVFFYQDQ